MGDSAIVELGDLDPIEALRAFYSHAEPKGSGLRDYLPGELPREDAELLFAERKAFEYLRGRYLGIEFRETHIGAHFFDREYGKGRAQRIVRDLRARGGVWKDADTGGAQ